VERRKAISGSWLLQVVDTAEGMINIPFIDGIQHRKAARAVSIICLNNCLQSWNIKFQGN
jgi:hypothetical protein